MKQPKKAGNEEDEVCVLPTFILTNVRHLFYNVNVCQTVECNFFLFLSSRALRNLIKKQQINYVHIIFIDESNNLIVNVNLARCNNIPIM